MLGNGASEKFIALLRTIAAKCGIVGHFVHGTMKSLNAGLGKTSGDIAYSEFNNLGVGVFFLESCDTLGDV